MEDLLDDLDGRHGLDLAAGDPLEKALARRAEWVLAAAGITHSTGVTAPIFARHPVDGGKTDVLSASVQPVIVPASQRWS